MVRFLVGALILSVAVIAAAMFGRYEITASNGTVVYRLDRLTGQVEACFTNARLIRQHQPKWCERAHWRTPSEYRNAASE